MTPLIDREGYDLSVLRVLLVTSPECFLALYPVIMMDHQYFSGLVRRTFHR